MTAGTTRLFVVLAVVGLATMFAGCSDSSNGITTDRPADQALLTSDTYALIDVDDALTKVDDATTDRPMHMRPVFDGGQFDRDPRHPRGNGSHLGSILRDLDITEAQLAAIRDLMMAYRETIRPALEGLHAANQEIVAAANEERRAILAALRNGDITVMQALQRLRQLNLETRDAIRDNPANEPFRAELCSARIDLLDAIRDVLDADQQTIWDAWRAGLPGDCANG